MAARLFNGDCLDILPTLAAGSVDLVLADMPYGTTGCHWDTPIDLAQLWPELWRVTRRGMPIVLFGSQPFTSVLVVSQLRHFRYELVWDKRQAGSGFNATIMPLKTHENIVVFGKGRLTYNPQMRPGPAKSYISGSPADHTHEARRAARGGRHRYHNPDGLYYPQSIIPIGNDKNGRTRGHPTPKDPALLRWLIRTYSDTGAVVLDFCMGGGGTGEAALQEGRDFIGIERDPGFFLSSEARIAAAQPPLLLGVG